MGTSAPSPPSPSPARVRLHITPFNPDLADRYLAPSVRAVASRISFHTIQTDPTRGFGYVELPAMEADKLKKKLNGMVLKGSKVKIEEAKPEKKRKQVTLEPQEEDDDDAAARVKKKAKKEKKKEKKGDRQVLTGHELEAGRHIKRGWEEKGEKKKTSSKEKKKGKRPDSGKGIDAKEMRFKTVVPPNATSIDGKAKSKAKPKDKEVKGKKTTVVKEFEYARKPAAGVSVTTGKRPVGYEDGKGWVDDEGQVLEPEPERTKTKRKLAMPEAQAPAPMKKSSKKAQIVHEQAADSDSDSSDGLEEESSVVSSDSEDDAASSVSGEADVHGSNDEVEKEVHPLEALFKRSANDDASSKPRPDPIDTSFSFFTGGADEGEEDNEAENDDDDEEEATNPSSGRLASHSLSLGPPQTPHTKRDLEWRALRSGAPTPDTAAINKRFDFSLGPGDEDDDDDDNLDESIVQGRHDSPSQQLVVASAADQKESEQEPAREESAFRKWFFENRGELNRSWKKRRREERKAQRQRENRRVGRKVA